MKCPIRAPTSPANAIWDSNARRILPCDVIQDVIPDDPDICSEGHSVHRHERKTGIYIANTQIGEITQMKDLEEKEYAFQLIYTNDKLGHK